MTLLKYILIGIVQGFTEPIPVSSSGHVMIVNSLLATGIDTQVLLIITNLGSLLAIMYIYREKIICLVKDFFSYIIKKDENNYSNYKYCIYLMIATIPGGIIGFIITKVNLFSFLENNINFVGITLLITALFLYLVRNTKGYKENDDITIKDAFIIGLFQVVALIPGISRSGSTIVGSLYRNLKRETAFDFSFLLYIPISLGTLIIGIKSIISTDITIITFCFYIVSMWMSTVTTYFATLWFKDVVKNGKLILFVIYCLLVGLLVILFL